MIGFLVRGRVRIKIRFRVRFRVRVGVTFNINIYHRSNCRRSKCRTFARLESTTTSLGYSHTYTVSGPSIWTTYDPPCVIIV